MNEKVTMDSGLLEVLEFFDENFWMAHHRVRSRMNDTTVMSWVKQEARSRLIENWDRWGPQEWVETTGGSQGLIVELLEEIADAINYELLGMSNDNIGQLSLIPVR